MVVEGEGTTEKRQREGSEEGGRKKISRMEKKSFESASMLSHMLMMGVDRLTDEIIHNECNGRQSIGSARDLSAFLPKFENFLPIQVVTPIPSFARLLTPRYSRWDDVNTLRLDRLISGKSLFLGDLEKFLLRDLSSPVGFESLLDLSLRTNTRVT